jgi:hypothetical protein
MSCIKANKLLFIRKIFYLIYIALTNIFTWGIKYNFLCKITLSFENLLSFIIIFFYFLFRFYGCF